MTRLCRGDGIPAKSEALRRSATWNSSDKSKRGWTRAAPVQTKRGTSMKNIVFNINGQSVTVEAEPKKPLLWVLREDLGLTGAKYGCGMAVCGCCTVHLNGDAIRSCVTPVARAEGKTVITIEGLSPDLSHPVQQAW